MTDIRRQHPDRVKSIRSFGDRAMIEYKALHDALLPSQANTDPVYEHSAEDVRAIIASGDRSQMREISEYFYTVSGIYRRILQLFATMSNFDNLVIPRLLDDSPNEKKLMKDFEESMSFVDGLNIKLLFPSITLSVFKNGVYFGYLRDDLKDQVVIQTLPTSYCESYYKVNNRFTVHFNLDYFDRNFYRTEDRLEALEQYPQEVRKAYNALKSGQLKGQDAQWVLLDTDRAICFKMTDEMPFFLSIIVDLIELREAKNIELSKDRLELFQLLIQKLPLGKDNEMVFDLPEAEALHKNALTMLRYNENIDVLTTFADMEMLNVKESRQVIKDNLLKTERSVFNEAGISPDLFRSEGNIALKYSVMTNEAVLRFLIPQYAEWLTHAITLKVKRNPKYYFEAFLPPTTIFNQAEMQASYTNLGTLGYTKLLPGVIAGMKQSSLLSMMKFENDYLKLGELMQPLQTSYTQGGDDEGGRPSKPDDKKDDGTVENINNGNQEGGND